MHCDFKDDFAILTVKGAHVSSATDATGAALTPTTGGFIITKAGFGPPMTVTLHFPNLAQDNTVTISGKGIKGGSIKPASGVNPAKVIGGKETGTYPISLKVVRG